MSDVPRPRGLTARDTFLEGLAALQETVEAHRELTDRLHKLFGQQDAGRLHPIKLNAARAYSDDGADHGARSFTVINPSPIPVALGTGGVGASNIAALSLPSAAAITLPVTAENLEVGPANPADLGTDDVWVFVITYQHVQPFFFGALS